MCNFARLKDIVDKWNLGPILANYQNAKIIVDFFIVEPYKM